MTVGYPLRRIQVSRYYEVTNRRLSINVQGALALWLAYTTSAA